MSADPSRLETESLFVRLGSALVVDGVADVFGAGHQEQRSVPELGRGADRRGIAQVYSHQGGLVFVVDPAVVAAAAREISASTIPPMLTRGS